MKAIESKRERGDHEASYPTELGWVELRQNVEADRVQLVFPDKPDEATRRLLKSEGFRWSPRWGAWQRHLNNAGLAAADKVLHRLHPAQTA